MNIGRFLLALALLIPVTTHAETKEEWITLGARIHGSLQGSQPAGANEHHGLWLGANPND